MSAFERILVPVDFGPASCAAASYAVDLACRLDAEVELFHAVGEPSVYVSPTGLVYRLPQVNDQWIPSPIRMALNKQIEMVLDHCDQTRRSHTKHRLAVGKPVDAILVRALEGGFDLIVLSRSLPAGEKARLLSSTSRAIRRRASCPVLLYSSSPPGQEEPAASTRRVLQAKHVTVQSSNGSRSSNVRRILVPTDFSALSTEAAALAWILGGAFNAKLLFLHVLAGWPGRDIGGALAIEQAQEEEQQSLEKLDCLSADLRSAVASSGARLPSPAVEAFVERGMPASTILHVARSQKVDLIVMGTHGRTKVVALLAGSVADEVEQESPCPVITVGPACARRAPRSRRITAKAA